MERESAHLSNLKHPGYKKWRHNTLEEPDLYKKCWKRYSLVFLDRPATHVIGILYAQHSTKFPEYGQHGFHFMKLSLVNEDLSCYMDSIITYIHVMYNNPFEITWFLEYIWWYIDDDDSKELHERIIHSTDGTDYILYELIDKGDIYVVRLIRNCENHPFANLRGKELRKYLDRKRK